MSENILKKILLISLFGVIIFGAFYKDLYPIDEWRYVVITQDLDKSFLKLKYAGEDYFEKPPFYFWILYTFAHVFGIFNFFSFKLPNIMASIIFVIVIRKYLMPFIRDYLLFLIIFFSMPMNIASIQLVRMDFLMNMFINLSILIIFRYLAVDNQRLGVSSDLPVVIFSSSFLLSGLFSSIAVLIKGPAGFFIPFFVIFTTLLIEKRFKVSYVLYFLSGFIPLVFLWFLFGYIYYGPSYIESYILEETAGRIIEGKHHNESVFYYLLFFLPCILPYSLIFFSSFKNILKSKFRFFLYWIIISITILSISRSKLIIYLSSILLPVSMIIDMAFEENHSLNALKNYMRITILFFVAIFALVLSYSWFGTRILYQNLYLAKAIQNPNTRIILIILIMLSLYFTKNLVNHRNFLIWWIVSICIISLFLYNMLNKHYDVEKAVSYINTKCKDKNIYIYKWKTLYYFKWRMKNNNIRFSRDLPEDEGYCIITSQKIYEEDKLVLPVVAVIPFTRDGGIVVFKNKK